MATFTIVVNRRPHRVDADPATPLPLDTVLLDSGGRPSGFGAHPVPLVAPAVADAAFAAVGARVRALPLTPAAISAARG